MKILGYNYTVDLSKQLSDMKGNSGFSNFDKQSLEVANDLGTDLKLSTLLHEIIEAINYHLSIGLAESDIMRLEAGLFQVLTDNGVNLSSLLAENKELRQLYTKNVEGLLEDYGKTHI